MSKPSLKQIGDAYRFTWAAHSGTVIEVDRFRESRGDLTAELTVYHPTPEGQSGLLHFAKLNLLSSTRSRVAKTLRERIETIDWAGLLEQVCIMSVERYRKGEPTLDLREVAPEGRSRWLLYPYIEHGGPTILAAPGGAGKSLVAMAMSYSIASGYAIVGELRDAPVPVLYLDYETSSTVHSERLRALATGLENEELPPIYYRRMTASLGESAAFVRKEIARLEVGFVVVDSLGYAGDGPPVEAATALGLFRAIRTLAVPTLAIHHQRKTPPGVKRSGNIDAIFGSVYFINSARRVWQLDSTAPDENEDIKYLSLTNSKANNGRLERTHALRMTLHNNDNERLTLIQVEPCRLGDIPEFAEKMALKQRILLELRGGKRDRHEIAEALDTTPGTVSKTLTLLKQKGKVVQVGGKQWGLLEDSLP
jgi:hypothetical protein